MRWKQYLTPVKSIDVTRASQILKEKSSKEIILLDVRQPKEYRQSHLPGAVLIPLPELNDRLHELDPEIPVLVYWAIGGRSRVAAQLLAGKGYQVLNLSGGIKAWHGHIAVGDETVGLDLFSGKESAEDVLVVAYSLELGLEDFYLSMAEETDIQPVRDLFLQLSTIETIHRDNIVKQYRQISGREVDHETFTDSLLPKTVEGGLSTDEYLKLFGTDLHSEVDVIGLAMSIEAQALDLYERTANSIKDQDGEKALRQIAAEEKIHPQQLGKLMDTVVQ